MAERNEKNACPTCKMHFIDVARHMSTAHKIIENKGRHCIKCDIRFKQEVAYNEHIVTQHPEDEEAIELVCKICFKKYATIANLQLHAKLHAEITEYFECDFCDFKTRNKGYLKVHKFKIHERTAAKSVECGQCGKMYASEFWMHRHKMNVHEKERRYPCPDCGKRFFGNQQLDSHLSREHGDGKHHICPVCSKAFFTLNSLRSHVKNTHGENGFKCDFCPYTTNTKAAMARHIQTVHKKERPFECDNCGRSYASAPMLRDHIKVFHEGTLSYKCDQCDFTCGYKAGLGKHVKSKHQNYRYQCKKCDKSYTCYVNLNKHVRIHHEQPDVKPFKCTVCDKSYHHKKSFKVHMTLHSDSSLSHHCHYCPFKTRYKDVLSKHIRFIHEGKGFECDVCKKMLSTACNLKRHVKDVHLNQTPLLHCKMCNYKTKYHTSIKLHVKNHHNNS